MDAEKHIEEDENNDSESKEPITFKSLVCFGGKHLLRRNILQYLSFNFQGLNDALCEACEKLGWKEPTKIQREALPVAFQSILLINIP